MLFLYLSMLETEEQDERFIRLYNKYSNLVFYIGNQHLHDDHLAEDCVQDTFLYLAQNFNKLNEDINHPSVKKLVSLVARARAIDIYRRRLGFAVSATEEDIAEIAEVPDSDFDFADAVDLADAVDRLSDQYKLVFQLKYYYGYNAAEIAEMCNISHVLARKRIMIAKQSVIKYLEGVVEENE